MEGLNVEFVFKFPPGRCMYIEYFFMTFVVLFPEEFLTFEVDTTKIKVCNPPTDKIKPHHPTGCNGGVRR